MYKSTDSIYKVKYKFSDLILKFFWKMQLGSLGKRSLIRSKTRILGNPRRIKIGDHFKIYENCIIAVGKGEIIIGNHGLLGVGTYINCGNEKLTIGNGVAVAPFCKIFTYSHHYASEEMIINTYKKGDITIEDNVLVGSSTIILPGVTIGRNSIIAAGSIVNADIPSNAIFGGSPARLIKMRE
jgi:acetyltransferase-like isoleucine patch superfamily enzyme